MSMPRRFAARRAVFRRRQVAALTAASRAAYARILPLLAERGRQGFIRRIHGDLHLGNIVLIDGRPVLFDAIEFSDMIASGDVLYDLAFLLMDLCERKLAAAANIVLNRYLVETRRDEDLDALAAMPFFLSMRAAIRAKVTAARLEQAEAEQAADDRARRACIFRLGLRFIAPPRAGPRGGRRIVRHRQVGAGAGAGAAIVPAPGAVVLRTDVERKALFGKGESRAAAGGGLHAGGHRAGLRGAIEKARRAVAAGHSAIVDAVFAKPAERELMEKTATVAGLPFVGLLLMADLETRVRRVGGRSHDASDADATVARAQESYQLGGLTWPRVDASGTPEETFRAPRARSFANGPSVVIPRRRARGDPDSRAWAIADATGFRVRAFPTASETTVLIFAPSPLEGPLRERA